MSNCVQFNSGQVKSVGSPPLSGTWIIYNDSGRTLNVGWIDYNGLVPNTGPLAAGSSISIPANHTYTRHPFLVSELNGQCYGYLYPRVGRVAISSSRGALPPPPPPPPPPLRDISHEVPPHEEEEEESKPVDVDEVASNYNKQNEEEEEEEEEETSYMWLWIVLAVVVFLIFGVVGVVMMNSGGGGGPAPYY